MGLAATRRGIGALVAIAIGLLPALVQPVTAGAAGTGTLFGMTGIGWSTLSKIDPVAGTMTPFAEVGSQANNSQVSALTGDPATHRIFGVRTTVTFIPPGLIQMKIEIVTVNSLTGAFTVSPPVNSPVGDLKFDPVSNTLYGLVPGGFRGINGVVRIDPSTGVVSAVASLGPAGPYTDSIAVAPQTHTIYVNRQDGSFPLPPVPPTRILTVNALTGAVSTGPIMSRAVRSITYDTSSNKLLGASECCPRDLLQIDPVTGTQTYVGNINNTNDQIFGYWLATDSISHTVHADVQTRGTGFSWDDHIVSINTLTGVSTFGPAIVAGNFGSLYFETAAVPPDTSPPVTSIALSPAASAAGWNNANVSLNLSATDPDGVADVATINYSATGAQTIAPTAIAGSSASFVVNTEGVTTVSYFAKDKAGNTESSKTQVIRIDKTLPTVTYTGNAGTYTVDQTVAITCAAVDPPNANGTAASGLASTTCANVNAPAYSFPLGPNTLSASATDVAGNIGNGSATFTVQVTNSSLCTLTVRFIEGSPNAKTSPALAEAQGHRLCKLLANAGSVPNPDAKEALVGAYQNGLTTLVDKGLLTADQAAILLTLSQAL
jgi:hypothetical protein